MATGISKEVFLAGVLKRRALIKAGKFRLKVPKSLSSPSPFKLIKRRGLREQKSEFYDYLRGFSGRGRGTGILPRNN